MIHNGQTLSAYHVKAFYKSQCCGQDLSCHVDLSQCNDCIANDYCSPPPAPPLSPPPSSPPLAPLIYANIVHDIVEMSPYHFIRITLTLSDSTKRFSGVQFNIDTNNVIDMADNDYTAFNLIKYPQGGGSTLDALYVPSSFLGPPSQIQFLQSNQGNGAIAIIYNPPQHVIQSERTILYIPVVTYHHQITITNIVVSDDDVNNVDAYTQAPYPPPPPSL
tara:strand:+ start:826 stop:1482 length:657 start_codon:yes stop_codon:yes gene_type:complete